MNSHNYQYKVGEIIYINKNRLKGTITEIVEIENRDVYDILFNNIVQRRNITIKYPTSYLGNTAYFVTPLQIRLATSREQFLYHLYGPYKEGELE